MRPLLLAFLFACDPAAQCRDEIDDLINEDIPAIVDQLEEDCRKQCESQIAEVEDLLAETADDLIDQCIAAVEELAEEHLIAAGCVEVDGHWDCSGVCE